MLPELVDEQVLNIASWDTQDGQLQPLLVFLADIIAVSHPAFVCVIGRQAAAIAVPYDSCEQARVFSIGRMLLFDLVATQALADPIECVGVDNLIMLARIGFAAVGDLAAIDPVAQHLIERAAVAITSAVMPAKERARAILEISDAVSLIAALSEAAVSLID
ncbi:hypothetical protein J2X44_000863 [Sphingopyxis sp. BE259]|nr:hypothetical protein [Sphingopyxis sp. BE259]MDR7226327.1 hypothetical protein [Sphingopyxis sp. BE259]